MKVRDVELNGKKVGEIHNIDGRIIYLTQRKPNHYFRVYQGFGLSVEIIWDIHREGVTEVVIKYKGKLGEKNLKSKLEDWIEFGTLNEDEIYGRQIILKEDKMQLV